MSLNVVQDFWTQLQELKLQHLQTWSPSAIAFADLSSINDLIDEFQNRMTSHLDIPEIHKAAHDLAQEVGRLDLKDFTQWNREENARARQAGESMASITRAKLTEAMTGMTAEF